MIIELAARPPHTGRLIRHGTRRCVRAILEGLDDRLLVCIEPRLPLADAPAAGRRSPDCSLACRLRRRTRSACLCAIEPWRRDRLRGRACLPRGRSLLASVGIAARRRPCIGAACRAKKRPHRTGDRAMDMARERRAIAAERAPSIRRSVARSRRPAANGRCADVHARGAAARARLWRAVRRMHAGRPRRATSSRLRVWARAVVWDRDRVVRRSKRSCNGIARSPAALGTRRGRALSKARAREPAAGAAALALTLLRLNAVDSCAGRCERRSHLPHSEALSLSTTTCGMLRSSASIVFL